MFNLKTTSGEIVKMRDGSPFVYSSRDLARIAKKLLETEKTGVLKIISV